MIMELVAALLPASYRGVYARRASEVASEVAKRENGNGGT
jgi:hypothetical protein